jgi:hypothetical protein
MSDDRSHRKWAARAACGLQWLGAGSAADRLEEWSTSEAQLIVILEQASVLEVGKVRPKIEFARTYCRKPKVLRWRSPRGVGGLGILILQSYFSRWWPE